MEVFRSEEYYVFAKEASSLWWNRTTGEFLCKSAWDLSSLDDIECLGVTAAIVGKVEHEAALEPRLMIVKDCSAVGTFFDDHIIYKIRSICLLSSSDDADADACLNPCKKHRTGRRPAPEPSSSQSAQPPAKAGLFDGSPFNKTWGAVKSAGSSIKSTTQQAAAMATSQVKQTVRKRTDSKERDKLEKRIGEELHKIFDDADSFYFCKTADITNSLQRLENVDLTAPGGLWRHADERFFWNKHMLKDIIAMGSPACEPWIIPIIQGHVQVRQCEVDAGECSRHLNTESLHGSSSIPREIFTLSLISRRSRFRAGTRYKRRGIDENGHVANYVETEQSLVHRSHRVSFVQVRGSAPLYWSQPGLKYRPPPRLDKGEHESQQAFNKHFDSELSLYGPVCIVNLVEQAGREKIIFDAYGSHVFQYNSSDVIYTTFDFHEYCRGMHFENVSVLINAITEIISDMGYCWRDPQGYICHQTGVFRVNCIDCLDRTNVVQTAIAKAVLEMQVTRLGLSGPDWPLPASLRSTLHELWADNGDIISRQYAGTNALKGDYTRTGERRFAGIMKDGMNSANRYYIQHFSDAFRQCCLDLLLGNPIYDSDIDYEMEVFSKLRTLGDIADTAVVPAVIEMPASSIVPIYFDQAIRDELLMLDLAYGLSRYYLSRFKDAFRQATIDLMLGEAEASELTMQHDGSETDEERQATADHVKQLIEDCKKLLVSESQNVVGAWGLIDADPGTGDPHETEMDSILILTRDSYLVADYDDHTDRVTKFEQVSLSDVTLIEFGIIESPSQMSLTSLKSNLSLGGSRKSSENSACIRIHYRIDNQDGYFHMFRSTNLRFFNNMAIYVKTPEEIHESLRSICECFMVTIEVAGLPKIFFRQGVKLDRRKSKPRPSSTTGSGRKTPYLEFAGLPSITRNLSETQIAIKSVGSKALTNMSEQFSKLNKLGHTFNTKTKPELPKPFKLDAIGASSSSKPVFTLGNPNKSGKSKKGSKSGNNPDYTSSDNSSDEEQKVNIFEPTLDNFEFSQKYVGDNPMLKSVNDMKADSGTPQQQADSEAYLIENPLYSSKIDSQTSGHDIFSADYLVDVESPESSSTIPSREVLNPISRSASNKLNPFNDGCARSTTPEITINFEESSSGNWDSEQRCNKAQPPSSLKLNQKLSRSSGEVDLNPNVVEIGGIDGAQNDPDRPKEPVRSSSQQDITLSITQSQSESALKQLKNITSPVASATKDLVLSPFSKIAKGVQSLGANLDPRKIKGGNAVKHVTEQQYEEHRKLQEKWKDCNTKLIAL